MLLSDSRILKDDNGYYYKRVAKNGRKRNERGIKGICNTCGVEIFIHKSVLKRQNKFYCSLKCQPVWSKDRKYTAEQKKKLNIEGLKKGHLWNKGKSGIYSKEYIQKLRISHTGKVGEKSSNWKGGITKKSRNRPYENKEWRKSVLKRDNYICQMCGTKENLEVHHKKSFAYYPELRFDVSNGITYCSECHCKVDKYRNFFKTIKRRAS